MESIRVFAPATVANVVCGFDILGFAVNAPGDEVLMRRSREPGVRITGITGDNGLLPLDPDRNTVSCSIKQYLEMTGKKDAGIEIELHKHMPIGSGLGSSSASTVAGIFAVNELLGRPLEKKELIRFAMQGEEMACGTGHADNVAPALLGGFTLVRSYDPLDIISLPYPEELNCSVVFPQVQVPTRDARKLIPSRIPFKDAVTQWGNIAGLVSGLCTKDLALIGRSMQDILVEPVRAILIPGFYEMRQLAMEHGALGFGISGSGPSVFALSGSEAIARTINEKLKNYLDSRNIGSYTYHSTINASGPKILD
jgi:homoserine kinase